MAQGSPTIAYLRGRERVLGSWRVHKDPSLAAEMLAELLGGRTFAVRWLLEVLDELERVA